MSQRVVVILRSYRTGRRLSNHSWWYYLTPSLLFKKKSRLLRLIHSPNNTNIPLTRNRLTSHSLYSWTLGKKVAKTQFVWVVNTLLKIFTLQFKRVISNDRLQKLFLGKFMVEWVYQLARIVRLTVTVLSFKLFLRRPVSACAQHILQEVEDLHSCQCQW